ncbi:hypothetical protein [Chromobacterium paludis]|uniref:Uncharacterized protein n=1 Tax=Chromobacterium paludis TaxID=2605945 RepID=A0A5C1DG37_9NEIS|nr:hypothetical protein [Chromobacterium paludis]QEL55513.1 hypothetical protein FYK34_08005 [Chromobacterium paludis]
MAKLPVKAYFSTDTGAPVWNRSPGSVLAILESCLVTGFNLRPCRAVSWANGVATISLDQGHGYKWPDVVELRDAVPSDANGEYRVKEAGADFIKVDCPIAITTVSAASLRRAPLGFSKPFAAGNVGVFKSQAIGSSGAYLRIDDSNPDKSNSGTPYTLIKASERMSDINTATGIFADGGITKLCNYDGSNEVAWLLIGDNQSFYLFCDYKGVNSSIKARGSFFFGDPCYATPPIAPGAACVVRPKADLESGGTTYTITTYCRYFNGSFSSASMSRGLNDVSANGSPITPNRIINIINFKDCCNKSTQDSAAIIPDIISAGGYFIGMSPGVKISSFLFPDLYYLENRYLCVHCICDNYPARSTNEIRDNSLIGCIIMDVIGPWR